MAAPDTAPALTQRHCMAAPDTAKWDPDWHTTKFVVVLGKLTASLAAMFPECAATAAHAASVAALASAPLDVQAEYAAQWHAAMAAAADGGQIYDLVKARREEALAAAQGPVATLQLAAKWPEMDAQSRGYLWAYLAQLNKHARFAALAPRKLLATLLSAAQGPMDMADLEGVVARLGPELAANFDELSNATQLLPDLLEEHLGGDAGASLVTAIQAMTGGTNGSLEDLVAAVTGALDPQAMAGFPNLGALEQFWEHTPQGQGLAQLFSGQSPDPQALAQLLSGQSLEPQVIAQLMGQLQNTPPNQ